MSAVALKTSSREVALQTLRDVFGTDARAAQEAFDYRIRRAGLDSRDRNFAAEMAYGAIKMRRKIDWFLKPYVGDRAKTLPPVIYEALRLGVYQVRFMGGVDAHAAVFETVNLALRHGHRGTAGLVNAVLRRFIADSPPEPTREEFASEDEYLGVAYSLPTWMVARLRSTFGERITAILEGINRAPQHAIRVNTLRAHDDAIVAELSTSGVALTRSPFVAHAFIAAGSVADDVQGRFVVQSESSAISVDMLAPQPDEHVVDFCSGRGQKTAQIAAATENRGRVESLELEARKATLQRSLLERVGATNVAIVVGNALVIPGEADADAVLLDAPCSGLGIIGRHPEFRWRKSHEDATRLAETQSALLCAAAARTKIGGRLVYSVCSTDSKEGVEVVNGFLEAHPAFVRAALPARYEPFVREGDVLVPPGIEGRDGFFVAALEHRA